MFIIKNLFKADDNSLVVKFVERIIKLYEKEVLDIAIKSSLRKVSSAIAIATATFISASLIFKKEISISAWIISGILILIGIFGFNLNIEQR